MNQVPGRLIDVFPPGIYLLPRRSPYDLSVAELFARLTEDYDPGKHVEHIVVRSAWYGRSSRGQSHEFILIEVEDTLLFLKNYIVLDRRTQEPHGVFNPFRGDALDLYRVAYNGIESTLLRKSLLLPRRYVEKIEFSSDHPLFLYQLATLTVIVSNRNPKYSYAGSGAHWFAGLIWECLCNICPYVIVDKRESSERGRLWLLRFAPNQEEVNEVCRKFETEIEVVERRLDAARQLHPAETTPASPISVTSIFPSPGFPNIGKHSEANNPEEVQADQYSSFSELSGELPTLQTQDERASEPEKMPTSKSSFSDHGGSGIANLGLEPESIATQEASLDPVSIDADTAPTSVSEMMRGIYTSQWNVSRISQLSCYRFPLESIVNAITQEYGTEQPLDSVVAISAMYCKKRQTLRHEFILFELENTRDPGTKSYTVLDRNKYRRADPPPSTSSSPSTVTPDEFKFYRDGNKDNLLDRYKLAPYDTVATIQFHVNSPLPFYQLAIIAMATSLQRESYDLLNANCYWFSGLVWEYMVQYPGATHTILQDGIRGTFGSLYNHNTDFSELDEVREEVQQLLSWIEAEFNGLVPLTDVPEVAYKAETG
ncbi:hypothetical protein FRC11_006930 [Ceratobasidium sp. 423]|nr:hypothetical protein FRC11_006930 [Ceratobasidium sp. 423]